MARKLACGKGVGHYICPNPEHKTPTIAVIREKNNARRTLYGFCGGSTTEWGCGETDWNLKKGQRFFLNHGTIWPKPDGVTPVPPDDMPDWIKKGRAMAPAPVNGDPDEAEPGEAQPVDTNLTAPPVQASPAPEPEKVQESPPADPEPVREDPPEKLAKKAGSLADLLPW